MNLRSPSSRAIPISLMIDGNEVTIPGIVFVRPGGSLDDYDDDSFANAFDYGYALTVHKAKDPN